MHVSQEGVLCKVADELADDTTKEALLLYTILLEAGRPVQHTEMAAMCQSFLQDHFMLQVRLQTYAATPGMGLAQSALEWQC